MISTPKFYVFYHGGPKQPERWKMRLSDSFLSKDDSGDFQWTATIINLHPEVSEEEQRRIWHKDGFTEGEQKGRSEKAVEAACNLLKMNILSPEQIAQVLTVNT